MLWDQVFGSLRCKLLSYGNQKYELGISSQYKYNIQELVFPIFFSEFRESR